MIRYTAKPPAERKRNIEERVSSKVSIASCRCSFSSFCQVNSANFNRDPYLRDYGLSVRNEMETVQGRVLPAPSILYQGERTVSGMGTYDYMDFSVCSYIRLAWSSVHV